MARHTKIFTAMRSDGVLQVSYFLPRRARFSRIFQGFPVNCRADLGKPHCTRLSDGLIGNSVLWGSDAARQVQKRRANHDARAVMTVKGIKTSIAAPHNMHLQLQEIFSNPKAKLPGILANAAFTCQNISK
ncbi:hypothetical protein ACLIMP_21555 [Novosphingobium aerophilum]|uniref:hypothetical protein n=1 Tax=Novosphingobium TaxID=165696 RepID=UPI0012C1A39E|nr:MULTISPECIES: hypothetical protein [unclassified Novosphingobium]MPS70141.1 hypothetical protein [Novosphingobium sp.]WRT95844.1 hypothetical protein U9J33_19780 [Novosphingobium sp. RL4]